MKRDMDITPVRQSHFSALLELVGSSVTNVGQPPQLPCQERVQGCRQVYFKGVECLRGRVIRRSGNVLHCTKHIAHRIACVIRLALS